MGPEGANSPWHFRELHLLPRVVFAIGAILFVISLNTKESALAFLGLALVFTAVGLNLLYDALHAPRVWKSGIVQGIVMVGCAVFCFYVAYHRYYTGDLPYFLQSGIPRYK
jgi:hypothetical protein